MNESAGNPAIAQQTEPFPGSRHREITFIEITNMMLRHWRMLVVLPVACAAIALLWGLQQERTYVALASFMPYGSEGSASSGAASLARQFGVDVGRERTGQSPQFFSDLLQRRAVLRETVESVYAVPKAEGGMRHGTLIDFYQVQDEGGLTAPWQRAVRRLRDNVSSSVSQETGLVELTVSAVGPELAEGITIRMLEILQDYNLEVQRRRAEEESRFVRERLEEAQSQLLESESALQGFLQDNRQFENSPDLRFDYDRLQRQVMMRQEVYTALLRLYEQTRIDAIRDTPVLTVIDHPGGAAQPLARKTILRAILGFMLGGLIAVVISLMIEFVRRERAAYRRDYEEFGRLVKRALDDIQRPMRWWSHNE